MSRTRSWNRLAGTLGVVVSLALPACAVVAVLYVRPLVEPAAGPGNDAGAALITAVERGDDAFVRRALERGTPADTADAFTGVTPLMWAAQFGRLEMMDLLLSRGASLRASCKGYGTPLSSAAFNGGPAAVRLLLDAGADPDVGTPSGHTPLMTAATVGDIESLDLLIRAGADVNAFDKSGTTALAAAENAGNAEAAARLLAAGAR